MQSICDIKKNQQNSVHDSENMVDNSPARTLSSDLQAMTDEKCISTETSIGNHLERTAHEKLIFLCSICFRQYDLLEDLRGHYILFHKYKLKDTIIALPPKIKISKQRFRERMKKIDKSRKGNEIKEKSFTIVGNVTAHEVSEQKRNEKEKDIIESKTSLKMYEGDKKEEIELVKAMPEIKPMPFKDFRLILRSNMKQRCTFASTCPYKFENETKLKFHIDCHISTDSNGHQFKCFRCDWVTDSWRRCSAHLYKVHNANVDLLQCPHCSYKASTSALVWRHMRFHKAWRLRVQRSLQAVQRRREQNLQRLHATTQVTPSPNKNKYYSEKTCDICDRKFVNGKTLSKHVKMVHNKIKPFICNVCGKKMARKTSLTIHMRQHTGERPLQCKTCKFTTRDPSVLHKHELRHGITGRIECRICDYTCIQTINFKRHMHINHPLEYQKISCSQCAFVTINEDRLKRHVEDHKKGLVVVKEDSLDATQNSRFKSSRKSNDKNNDISQDCFLPLESIDSLPHEPALDTGGVTIPAPSEETQFPTYLNS